MRCPNCARVMRFDEKGWACRCGYKKPYQEKTAHERKTPKKESDE